MSQFTMRVGPPQVGDIANNDKTDEDVMLVDKIKTEYGSNCWIATDSDDKYIIVNEDDLRLIGYYS